MFVYIAEYEVGKYFVRIVSNKIINLTEHEISEIYLKVKIIVVTLKYFFVMFHTHMISDTAKQSSY